jgi:hypothetical protein
MAHGSRKSGKWSLLAIGAIVCSIDAPLTRTYPHIAAYQTIRELCEDARRLIAVAATSQSLADPSIMAAAWVSR